MATRLSNPVPQHFDKDTVAPLSGGKMFFFEPGGSTTPKDTFTDVSAATANTNPVILDANGFEPNIFGEGSYRIVLQNSAGVQQWARDPVDFESQTGAFSDWLATVTYNVNDIVQGSDGNFYVSIQDNNINNDPLVSPTFWTLFYLYKRWNPNETYPAGSVVLSLEGKTYEALISTLNVDPDTDITNTNWKQFDNLRIDQDTLFSATNTGSLEFGATTTTLTANDIDITAATTDIDLTSTAGDITIDSTAANVAITSDLASSITANTGNLTLSSTSGNFDLNGAVGTITANTGNLSLTSTAANFLLNGEAGTISSDTTNIAITSNTSVDVTSTTNTVVTAVDIELNNSGTLTSNTIDVSLAPITIQNFSTPGAGVWNRPANVKYIQVELVGGGGAGGSNGINANEGGQGGGAGAYIRSIIDVTATASINFTVGAGGVGIANNPGNNGGATIFSASTVLTAGGGVGGQVGNILAPNSNNGGTPTNGNVQIFGGAGGIQSSNTTAPAGGHGGASYFGGGPNGPRGTSVGILGNVRGAGGSGAVSVAGGNSLAGGNGRDGIIIVTEYR